MKSSYKENHYGNVFKALAISTKPRRIVEFGILEAYSLTIWAESCPETTQISAYDIFEDFPYNAADYKNIVDKFKAYNNISINRANFFGTEDVFKDGEIDILHIDIANDGDVYKYAIDHYMQKVSSHGICILEGGSESRDSVYWMKEFNKTKIKPIIEEETRQAKYNILVLEDYPSVTLITHKKGENNVTS